MSEYTRMRVVDLQGLLRGRKLPRTGNKAALIKRLQDDDTQNPVPASPTNYESGSDMLRRRVHQENLRKLLTQLEKKTPSATRMESTIAQLKCGKCLEPTCCLCGTGTLSEATEALFGRESTCTDGTCASLEECYKCRTVLQEPYIRIEQNSCAGASCGNLPKCIRCESCIRVAIVPTSLPAYLQGPYDPAKESGDKTELRHILEELRRSIHNRYLRKLILKFRNEAPDATEWNTTKQKLQDGKCLGLACSSYGTAPLAESMETLVDGPDVDCGGGMLAKCRNQHKCPSCRQLLQAIDDKLAREDQGCCNSGHCGLVAECNRCRDQPHTSGSARQATEHRRTNHSVSVERYCVDDDCEGIKTCWNCQYEKEYEDMKQADADREEEKCCRFQQQGQCDGPDSDSELPYGLGCRYFDCQRCGMIEAKMGPRMRNDALRRHRASKVETSFTESSNGTPTGTGRKRRFSNFSLEYPIPPHHPLAQLIRTEDAREQRERRRAQVHHERPFWFGTPEDPLPDFWMGRPVLPEKEINILKILDSIPKYYLSQSEEDVICFAEGAKEKRFCAIIRRLEAELMSRDFWMQSLGYDAYDTFGNAPSGHYTLTSF